MSNMYEVVVRAEKRHAYGDLIEVRVMEFDHPAAKTKLGQITMAPLEEGTWGPPTLKLSASQAQVLMDDLWQCGLRPSEGTGSAGALAATQAHLKDLQTLTFKFVEKAKF